MVMDSLGIDVGASDSDNMKTFKKMTVDTGVFMYAELVAWFRILSKLRNCHGMAVCAEDYACRLAEVSSRKTKLIKAIIGLKRRRSSG